MQYLHKTDETLGDMRFFQHVETPIVGINNKTFIDFSKYADWDLNRIDDEICIGLALTDTTNIPTVTGEMPPEIAKQYDGKVFEAEYLWNVEDQNYKNIIKKMSVKERRKYLLFKNKIILPWHFISILKFNMFATKSQDLHPWESFVDLYMPYTKSCIEKLPFKTIGRVVIYGSLPNIEVPCHRDDIITNHKDHHVNFNPGGYRPVYIYDSIKKEKHYLDKTYRIYAYNVRDYHGVDAIPDFSYTVRVDGEYTDEVCEELGLVNGEIR